MRVRFVAATLAVTLTLTASLAHAQTPARVSLVTGFTNDPYSVAVTAGGPIDLNGIFGDACRGWVTEEPSVVLNYQAGDRFGLDLYTLADIDTVLVVREPDGEYWCDDGGGNDGADWVGLKSPTTGDYAIWVGVFSRGTSGPAILNISETYVVEARGGQTWSESVLGDREQESSSDDSGWVDDWEWDEGDE